MADAIRPYSEQENVKIYAVTRFEYSLPYYLQRHVTLVNFKGNMAFGISREPKDWLESEEALMPIWLASDQALAILSLDRYQQWLKQNMPMKIVYQDPRRIVVAKN